MKGSPLSSRFDTSASFCSILSQDHKEHQEVEESNDFCSSISECVNCTIAGCNYCSSGMTTSRCTSIKSAKEANCDMSACATDRFVTTLSGCFGLCSEFTDCNSCLKIPECSWCHSSSACVDSKDSSCTYLSSECYAPCEMQIDCFGCLQNNRDRKSNCSWCGREKKCKDSSMLTSECESQTCPAIIKEQKKTVVSLSKAKQSVPNVLFLGSALFIFVAGIIVFRRYRKRGTR